jgi:hypothetical protein
LGQNKSKKIPTMIMIGAGIRTSSDSGSNASNDANNYNNNIISQISSDSLLEGAFHSNDELDLSPSNTSRWYLNDHTDTNVGTNTGTSTSNNRSEYMQMRELSSSNTSGEKSRCGSTSTARGIIPSDLFHQYLDDVAGSSSEEDGDISTDDDSCLLLDDVCCILLVEKRKELNMMRMIVIVMMNISLKLKLIQVMQM